MIAENPYMPLAARLEEVIEETPTIKTLVVRPEEPMPFRAGQFIELTVPGLGEAPFTPSSSPAQPDRLEITILKTGTVTDKLHEVQPGDTLGLRGPFGKGYPIDKLKGKDVLLVGGGVGLAPLRALMYVLFDQIQDFPRVSIKYGARAPEELLFRRSYDEWRCLDRVSFLETIDAAVPGWTGRVGVVTTLLASDEVDVDTAAANVVSCGPPIMLKFVTGRCLELGFSADRIYLSLNRKMSCGIGKCGRCNIGPYYLCKDGPDMCYAEIQEYENVF